MPEARGAMIAGFIDGAIYVAGGVGPRSTLALPVLRYDPTANQWRAGANIPTPREHLAGFVYEGRLYALGGRRLTLDSVSNAVERYDPRGDRWESLAPMPTARGGFAAAVSEHVAIASGGELEAEALITADALDLRTMTWSRAPSMRVPHHGHGSVALGGRVYVVGGGVRPILAATAIVESLAAP
jgi:non-specific serine/threonine protein kinase